MTFAEFLQRISLRYLQERDVPLDLYLSGIWGWILLALFVVCATIFVLAIFHVIPKRQHSVSLLFVFAVGALVVGGGSAYLNFTTYILDTEAPQPAIFTAAKGRTPETDAHKATLLLLPLLVAIATAAMSIVGGFFLLVFGGREDKTPDGRGDKGQTRKSRDSVSAPQVTA